MITLASLVGVMVGSVGISLAICDGAIRLFLFLVHGGAQERAGERALPNEA